MRSVTPIAFHLLDAARSGGISNGAGLFLLQLLAWDYLDRTNSLPEDLSLTKVGHRVRASELIRLSFTFLSHSEKLGPNADGFRLGDYDHIISRIPEGALQTLIEIIVASRGQELDYLEAIDAFSRLERYDESYSTTPDEVAELIIKLAGIEPHHTVYCPFERTYKLAERSNRITRTVYMEPRVTTPLPFLLNILLEGSIRVLFGDAIKYPSWVENGRLKLFDISVCNPPFGIRHNQEDLFDPYYRFPEKTLYGEVLHIRHVLAQTRQHAVITVPHSILVRNAAGERQFKADILESGLLQAVITLPSSLLLNINIPFSILVFNKEQRFDSVLFIDASSEHFYEDAKGRSYLNSARRTLKNIDQIVQIFKERKNGPFSYLASQAECEANEYNLLADRYVLSGEDVQLKELLKNNPVVPLGDISEILRPQTLKDYLSENGHECYEVGVSDIGEDGYIVPPKKKITISEKALDKLHHQVLKPNDILLAVKGSVGKVGLVPSNLSGTWLANQSFQVLRPKEHMINPIVLYCYLSSPAGQSIIQARSVGTTVPMIQTRDVKALPIILPPMAEQLAIAEQHKKVVAIYEEIERLKAEAQELSRQWWTL